MSNKGKPSNVSSNWNSECRCCCRRLKKGEKNLEESLNRESKERPATPP